MVPRGRYKRDVLVLVVGTSIAQGAPVLVSPILSRLYVPDEFGVFALYMALVNVLAVVVTGRYEQAIPLPDAEVDAADALVLSIRLAIVVSTALFLPVVLFGDQIAGALGSDALTSWLYVLPVSVACLGIFNSYQLWLNRLERYRTMAEARVELAGVTTGAQLLLGATRASGGMVMGAAFGHVLIAGRSLRSLFLHHAGAVRASTSPGRKRIARRYRRHPLNLAPSQLVGTAATQLPVIAISAGYSIATAGLFSLAYRLVALPTALVGAAIGDVYRQRIAVAYNERGEFRHIYLQTIKRTALLSVVPFTVLFLVAPSLFVVVFGEEWRTAGDFAQILVVAAFFQFIFVPIDKGAIVVGATRYILCWQTTRLLLALGLLFVAVRGDVEVETVLWLFVLSNTSLYLVDGFVEYRLAGGRRTRSGS